MQALSQHISELERTIEQMKKEIVSILFILKPRPFFSLVDKSCTVRLLFIPICAEICETLGLHISLLVNVVIEITYS